MADFSAHTAEITRDRDVKSSAINLINTFQSRLDQGIADAVKANDDVDLSTLNALSADLKANTDALAAAVAANTPGETGGGTGEGGGVTP
jgi:hypothetical protein